MPNLSFAFLSFNNWPVFEQTLQSAKSLKHSKNVEWVIVDNSLPEYQTEMVDNTIEWLDDNNIVGTYIVNQENTGEGAGMNKCFELCKSNYILFFQDDWKCVVDYNFIDLGIEVLDRIDHIFMIQLSKRPWSITNKNCKFGRVLIPPHNGLSVIEMGDNGFGNNTSQVRLFKKSKWERVGPYLTRDTIDWNTWNDAREGSIVEFDYGVRLQRLGFRAAKINDGQFEHLLPENSRKEHFIKGSNVGQSNLS